MATKKAAKPAAAKKTTKSGTDSLTSFLAASLNKKFKTGEKVAYVLGDDQDSPSNISGWVSTGSTLLNIAISNKPDGGFPIGRISVMEGLEGTGKSLVTAHALADTQRQNGIAVMIDTENAVSKEFITALGVDINRMLYIPTETMEDCLETADKLISSIREKDKDRLLTIIIDSVAGATTKVEQASDYDKDGFSTTKAIVLSKGLRKLTNMIGKEKVCVIFTNQLREKPGVMFGDKYTAPGGKALNFHASFRGRVKSVGQITKLIDGIKHVIGIDTEVIVKKNRMGPPHGVVQFPILFDSGIDDINSWLIYLKKVGTIQGSGKSYSWPDQKLTFESKNWAKLINETKGLREAALKAISDKMIMHYKIERDTLDVDDFVTETEDELENSSQTE